MSESESSDNKSKDTTECMERADLNDETDHYEQKLKHIEWEYSNSMIKDWPKIRDKKLFFRREIARLKKFKNEKETATSSSPMVNNNIASEEKDIDKNKNIDQSYKNKAISEEEQWDINNKLLTEIYEEEELMKEMLIEEENYDASEEYSDFINSQDDIGLHNLENAMEAMEVENSKRKRTQYGSTSVKEEGPQERPSRSAGRWPPEKVDFQPSYILGQYRHMGTKGRDFEKLVQF
jgi:hypothetical protein